MTTQEIETINKLKQHFSDNFLGNSNEIDFEKFLDNIVLQGNLAQSTAKDYLGIKPKKFFMDYFEFDIFRAQSNSINFLKLCLNEMRCGVLKTINSNTSKRPNIFNPNIYQFNGTPSASLKYYIEFLQQKGIDSKENKSTTDEDSDQNKGENMKTNIPPLNQILYGPPGTGKTYNTIDKALEIFGYAKSNDNGKTILNYDKIKQELQSIANNQKDVGLDLENLNSKNDRELAKLLFDYYCSAKRSKEQRQIEFVTFHQSFSYEEFVEGIKPKLIDSSNGAESSEMSYTIKSGILKEICNRASYKEYKSEITEIQTNTKTRVWKISIVAKSEDRKLRDEVLKHCLEKDEIRIGWGDNKTLEQISMLGRNDQSSIYQFENEADIGDIVCVFENANGDIKGIGMIESEFYWDDDTGNSEALKLYPRVRKVKWLSKEQINIRDLNGGTNLTQKTFYPLDRVNAIELLNRIGKLDKKDLVVDNTQKPFVLIIDEINRGNISKILGELITLIEPSKRIGASNKEKARGIGDESLEVTLPYSNETFGVPSNLYIIGTMNTADRSIALLDTALRRRFEFVEMMPNCKELQKIWLVGNDEDSENSSIDEWNTDKAKVLYEILTAINNRIEFLLDREHTIGHAFFFEKAQFYKTIYDENNLSEWERGEWYELSLDSLKEIFAKKIIPLLQEYFYDDYAKIQAVLNNNGMIKSFSKQKLEVNLSDDFVDNEKRVYRITDSSAWNATTFTKIYE